MEILQLIGDGHWHEWPQSAYALINMQIEVSSITNSLVPTNKERAELSRANLTAQISNLGVRVFGGGLEIDASPNEEYKKFIV